MGFSLLATAGDRRRLSAVEVCKTRQVICDVVNCRKGRRRGSSRVVRNASITTGPGRPDCIGDELSQRLCPCDFVVDWWRRWGEAAASCTTTFSATSSVSCCSWRWPQTTGCWLAPTASSNYTKQRHNHSFVRFNSGSKAHKTTDKSKDIKAYAYTNIKTIVVSYYTFSVFQAPTGIRGFAIFLQQYL